MRSHVDKNLEVKEYFNKWLGFALLVRREKSSKKKTANGRNMPLNDHAEKEIVRKTCHFACIFCQTRRLVIYRRRYASTLLLSSVVSPQLLRSRPTAATTITAASLLFNFIIIPYSIKN